jgi:hypothetical protein
MIRFFAVLVFASVIWGHQSSDPSQKQRDTPGQQPGTKNPDMGQRKAATHAKGHSKSTSADTPQQHEPETSSPDTAKRHAPKKKNKTDTSTAH